MKILHVLHGFPPEHEGGTEKYVARLAAEQARAGAEVAVAAGSFSQGEPHFVEVGTQRSHRLFRVSKAGFENDRWDHGASPHIDRAFDELLERLRPDLVHVHQWIRLTRSLVRRSARRGIPVVLTLHDLYSSCPRIFRVRDDEAFCERPLSAGSCLACVPREDWMGDEEVAMQIDRFAGDFAAELASASAIVAPSSSHLEVLARFAALDPAKAHVVQHATASELSSAAAEPWEGGRRLRLAHWGHLLPFKGVHVLLEALQGGGLASSCELALWGPCDDPDFERRLSDLAADLTVDRRERFDAADLESLRVDVAVFPSLAHESWSFVVDEAFALGLPVIASDRGAPRDRIGAAGSLVPVADIDALRAAIRGLHDDPGVLARMRAAIPEATSLADHWTALQRVYEKAIASGPAQGPELDDELEWERVAMLYEARARVLAGTRAAAEEEVEAMRRELRELYRQLGSDAR